MLRTQTRFKRFFAAAASAAVTAVSIAGIAAPLSVAAADDVELKMSVLAGGSRIGMAFIVDGAGSPGDYIFQVDGSAVEAATNGSYIIYENAMNTTKQHKLEVIKDGETVAQKETSVAQYLSLLMQYSEFADYQPLALSMLKYGAAAQKYFGVDTQNIAVGEYDLNFDNLTITESPFNKAELNDLLEMTEAPVSYYGMNLSLLSETTFRLFFRIESGYSVTDVNSFLTNAKFNGTTAEIKKNGNNYIELSMSVPASALTDYYELKSDVFTFGSFSPVQYLAAAQSDGDANLVTLSKALYSYATEAKKMKDYVPPQPESEKWERLSPVSGTLTFYDPDEYSSCANLDDFISDHELYVAALSDDDYEQYIGAYILITYGEKTVKALVGNILPLAKHPDRKKGDVDLDKNAATALGLDPTDGGMNITWRIIPLETAESAPISYVAKKGASVYWGEIQVRNTMYPVAKLEYKVGNGDFIEMLRKRDGDNYFYNYYCPPNNQFGSTNLTFKITDIFGDTVIDENVSFPYESALPADTPFDGSGVQFSK